MKGNNKGFSLVELLVSFAILGLVSTIIMGITVSGTNMFNRNKKILSLQYKSQLASNQLHNYLQNCDGALAAGTDELWVARKGESASQGTIYYFSKPDDENVIYLRIFDVSVTEDEGVKTTNISYTKSGGGQGNSTAISTAVISDCLAEPLCSGVTSWSVDVGATDTGVAKYASVILNFELTGSAYSKNITESFRSKPIYVSADDVAPGSSYPGTIISRIWG